MHEVGTYEAEQALFSDRFVLIFGIFDHYQHALIKFSDMVILT